MSGEKSRRWKLSGVSRLIIYFVIAGALAALAIWLGLDATGRDTAAGAGTTFGANPLGQPLARDAAPAAALRQLAMAVITAVAFAIPVSITYALTKRREGYDRAVVQMIIILPLVVACVVLVVKGSLALAFALAGIAAVVRFRATFRDVKDAVFGFAAIGIGLAAGVQSLVVAAGLSFSFCILAIFLWKLDIGNVRTDLSRFEGEVPLSEALVPVGPGEPVVKGKANPLADPDSNGEVAREAARLDRIIQADAETQKKKDRFTHLLLVHTSGVPATRDVVESVLEDRAKRWRFVSQVPYQNGSRTLAYLARLRARTDETRLTETIHHKGESVVGVELKPVDALRDVVT